jgi:protein-tyrosine phosphatase
MRALQAVGVADSFLFICYGNICRSPYAAAVFRRMLPSPWQGSVTIRQAGLFGHGRHSPGRAIEAAFLRGVDLSEHRSTHISPEAMAGVKIVVVMSREQQKVIRAQYPRSGESVLILGDLDPLPIDTRTIVDPYARSAEVFDASYARIDRCLEVMVAALLPGPNSSVPIEPAAEYAL